MKPPPIDWASAAGRQADAIRSLELLVAARPQSAVAEHNLAAALGDAGDAAGACDAAMRAMAKGGNAPETWLVLARALVALSRLTEADAALTEALHRRPGYADALRDRVQLRWMQTGDPKGALGEIDALLASSAATPTLAQLRASIAREIMDPLEAYRGLEPWLEGPHPHGLDIAASSAAAEFDPQLALDHAEAAVEAAPADIEARVVRLGALLAIGRAAEAAKGLDDHLAALPDDQYALALRYVAWRVLGDPRALSKADYERLARPFDLTVPTDPDSDWLKRAATGLRKLHPFRAQPLGQSIRSGVQAALDPRYAGDPAIDTIFARLTPSIETYVADMAGRADPMSRRASPKGGHEVVGAWSVRLKAGGRHSDHVHPKGWVSSAFYVEMPSPLPDQPRAGWLRLGGCRLGVGLELAPEYWVEAMPGRVVLFPSWMWHGTEPFQGDGERLTVAFDVQPG
ncbi:putative 2OG-Fe(II) oxygenase [Brevundimonas subvibrioides]|uniref:putative 2OG-Fe(II) oxygenase n=1 Tax=Brevundimonas subvibrioides TaxID=74313 RepID=UPI0022B454A5|nr:putative 2OG-Fe(II) oxygenase [Brevundimonas subvibrioides]